MQKFIAIWWSVNELQQDKVSIEHGVRAKANSEMAPLCVLCFVLLWLYYQHVIYVIYVIWLPIFFRLLNWHMDNGMVDCHSINKAILKDGDKNHQCLTHCGLVTPRGDIDLSQHWLGQWLVAWRHQAITRTSVDLLSVRSSHIRLRAISQEIPQPSISKISLSLLIKILK